MPDSERSPVFLSRFIYPEQMFSSVEFCAFLWYDSQRVCKRSFSAESYMKKRDYIAAGVIILIALLIGCAEWLFAKPAQTLRITIDGDIYGEYSLEEDQEIAINDTNICVIENGQVRMTWADCPDQICVHTAAIAKDGGSIVCLPNKIVLEIRSESKTEDQVDSISS